jgi:hypothetical protein
MKQTSAVFAQHAEDKTVAHHLSSVMGMLTAMPAPCMQANNGIMTIASSNLWVDLRLKHATIEVSIVNSHLCLSRVSFPDTAAPTASPLFRIHSFREDMGRLPTYGKSSHMGSIHSFKWEDMGSLSMF